MLKKMVSIALALVLVVSLGACGKGASNDVQKSSDAASISTQSKPQETTNTDNKWKVSEKPITISALGHMTSNYVDIKDYNEILGIKEFSKITNLNFEWQMTNPQNEAEQINLTFATKKMPDIYTHIKKTDSIKYGSQGALVDLLPLINKHAPNIKKVLDSNPSIAAVYGTTDGKLYMLPKISEDYRISSWRMFLVQKGWLDKLGLKVPENTDDLYNTLKAFKENASKLTTESILPYTSFASDNLIGWFDVFSWPFGMYGARAYPNKNGEIVYGVMQPEFKEAIAYVRKLYAEGLIDADLDANKDDATFEAKITNNRAGIIYVGQGRMGIYNQKAGPKYPGFEYIPLIPVKGPTGIQEYGDSGSLANDLGLAISINNKNPIETIKAWDFVFSNEGMKLMNFGIEGETYTVKDGIPTYTDKIMKDTKLNANQALIKYISPLYDFPCVSVYDFERSQLGPVLAQYKTTMKDMKMLEGVRSFGLNNVPTSEAQIKQFASVETDLNIYVNESLVKFIKGEWTMEENYSAFVNTLKKMRVDELLEVLNEGYKKYSGK